MPTEKNEMAEQPSQLVVSKAAVKEIEALSDRERGLLIKFLKRLASNPYDPAVIQDSRAHGDFFAYRFSNDIYLYWSLALPGLAGSTSKERTPVEINVLGLARKAAQGNRMQRLKTA